VVAVVGPGAGVGAAGEDQQWFAVAEDAPFVDLGAGAGAVEPAEPVLVEMCAEAVADLPDPLLRGVGEKERARLELLGRPLCEIGPELLDAGVGVAIVLVSGSVRMKSMLASGRSARTVRKSPGRISISAGPAFAASSSWAPCVCVAAAQLALGRLSLALPGRDVLEEIGRVTLQAHDTARRCPADIRQSGHTAEHVLALGTFVSLIPLKHTTAVKRGDHRAPTCEHGDWVFAGADFKRRATKWRCPTGDCEPRSVWRKASRLHPLIPRETKRFGDLYRGRGAVERTLAPSRSPLDDPHLAHQADQVKVLGWLDYLVCDQFMTGQGD
jgi:hypothetical protein